MHCTASWVQPDHVLICCNDFTWQANLEVRKQAVSQQNNLADTPHPVHQVVSFHAAVGLPCSSLVLTPELHKWFSACLLLDVTTMSACLNL